MRASSTFLTILALLLVLALATPTGSLVSSALAPRDLEKPADLNIAGLTEDDEKDE